MTHQASMSSNGHVWASKRKKAVGHDGVPHRLLGMLPDDMLHTLYEGLLEVWRTGDIPQHCLRPEVVSMNKKGDPDRPENYRPIAVTNSIYRVIMKLCSPCLQCLVDWVVGPEQYGSRPLHTANEQAATLVNTLHEHEMEGREPFVVLLDVAKAFPSTIHEVIFPILNHDGPPPKYLTAFRTIYAHTDTYTDIQGERNYFKPTRGVKEGCRSSSILTRHKCITSTDHGPRALPEGVLSKKSTSGGDNIASTSRIPCSLIWATPSLA